MEQPVAIGLDPAKGAFQVRGAAADGRAALRRRLRRSQVPGFSGRPEPCMAGMEARPGAHRRARDPAGAEAVRGAAARPAMRFVPAKPAGRQAALPDHAARDVPVRQRTRPANAIRAHLPEFGIAAAEGIRGLDRLLGAARGGPGTRPARRPTARSGGGDRHRGLPAGQLRDPEERTGIAAARKTGPPARRPATIPGLGPVASPASAAAAPGVAVFRSARDRAARRQGAVRADLRGRDPLPAAAALSRRDGAGQHAAKIAAAALAARMARPVRAPVARGSSCRAVPGREGDRRREASGGPRMAGRDARRWRRAEAGRTEHPVRTGAAQTAGR
ncbi:hypothetical protein [Mangrovicoccus sp. HB161399]|uniref:hypothetical protein n=1 Tax=Mangrovicoccus sp. HB161399 TaxID=2720392 RepID=UPI001551F768|nr:hypothetical protein [Mangrovicoccus sp. HB161399]